MKTPEPNIDQLKKPIEQVKSLMSTLAPIADSATELKGTLPAMLGAEGKRNYLIMLARVLRCARVSDSLVLMA